MILLDSDICIDWLSGKLFASADAARAFRRRRLFVSTVTIFEVSTGLRSEEERAAADAMLSIMMILPLDEPAAQAAAAIDRELRAQGTRLATADTLIAGIAVRNGLALLTRNRRHFERVPGLTLETI